jgi:SOS-response transcriptional repressor LexA
MTFGEYLEQLIKEKGYSYRKVAMLSGVNHSYISRLVRNVKERPSPEILAKLAPPLGTTYEDLMRAAGYLPDSPENTRPSHHDMLEMSIIPHIGDPTAPPPYYVRDANGKYVTIPKKFLVDGDFLWRVSGTSLPEAGIKEGDYVVIKRKPVAAIGEIALIQTDTKITLKRIETYNEVLSHTTCDATIRRNIGVVISSHRLHTREKK